MINNLFCSICLFDYGYSYSKYGFKSWILQDYSSKFKVIINVLNKEDVEEYKKLSENKSENCEIVINQLNFEEDYNIPISNNIGLQFSKDCSYSIFPDSDIIYKSDFLTRIINFVEKPNISLPYCVIGRYILGLEFLELIKDRCSDYNLKNNFDDLFVSFSIKDKNPIEWGCCLGKTKLFHKLGGFDEKLLVHYDADMDIRAVEYCRDIKLSNMNDFRFYNIFYGLQLPILDQEFRNNHYEKFHEICIKIVNEKTLDDYFVDDSNLKKLDIVGNSEIIK